MKLMREEHLSIAHSADLHLPDGIGGAPAPDQHRVVWLRRAVSITTLVAASIMAVMAVRQSPSERTKGHGAVSVAVRRDGVVSERLLDPKEHFHHGDALRIRVAAGVQAWVLIQKNAGTSWSQVFLGHPDSAGWLPLSLTISDAPAVPVRVVVCADEPDGTAQDTNALTDCSVQETLF